MSPTSSKECPFMPRKSTPDRSGSLRFASPAVSEVGARFPSACASANGACRTSNMQTRAPAAITRRSRVKNVWRGEAAEPADRPACEVSILFLQNKPFEYSVFEMKEHLCSSPTNGDVAVPEPALPLEWCSEAWPRLPFRPPQQMEHPGWDHFLPWAQVQKHPLRARQTPVYNMLQK